MISKSLQFAGVCFAMLIASTSSLAQISNNLAKDNLALFGEFTVRVNGTGQPVTAPPATLILFSPSGKELARPTGPELSRQKVMNGGHYRFDNLTPGEYELVVEINTQEVSRNRIILTSLHAPYGLEQNIVVDWQPLGGSSQSPTVSAEAVHERSAPNKRLFKKAEDAVAAKDNDKAIAFLSELVANDKADYQAQAILGTLMASQGKYAEAEQAYASALSAKPNYPQALLDFGRLKLRQKKFPEAIDLLTRLVGSQPQSGEANLLLGDAYAQANRIAEAIPFLQAAASHGYAEARLRLAWIYDASGSKDKAALEYEQFLKQKPEYPDRQKLEAYIKVNKKN